MSTVKLNIKRGQSEPELIKSLAKLWSKIEAITVEAQNEYCLHFDSTIVLVPNHSDQTYLYDIKTFRIVGLYCPSTKHLESLNEPLKFVDAPHETQLKIFSSLENRWKAKKMNPQDLIPIDEFPIIMKKRILVDYPIHWKFELVSSNDDYMVLLKFPDGYQMSAGKYGQNCREHVIVDKEMHVVGHYSLLDYYLRSPDCLQYEEICSPIYASNWEKWEMNDEQKHQPKIEDKEETTDPLLEQLKKTCGYQPPTEQKTNETEWMKSVKDFCNSCISADEVIKKYGYCTMDSLVSFANLSGYLTSRLIELLHPQTFVGEFFRQLSKFNQTTYLIEGFIQLKLNQHKKKALEPLELQLVYLIMLIWKVENFSDNGKSSHEYRTQVAKLVPSKLSFNTIQWIQPILQRNMCRTVLVTNLIDPSTVKLEDVWEICKWDPKDYACWDLQVWKKFMT